MEKQAVPECKSQPTHSDRVRAESPSCGGARSESASGSESRRAKDRDAMAADDGVRLSSRAGSSPSAGGPQQTGTRSGVIERSMGGNTVGREAKWNPGGMGGALLVPDDHLVGNSGF